MEIYSYFFQDKCLFGSYPTISDIKQLKKIGVKYFVDLTTLGELDGYKCDENYISYPIRDNNIPTNKKDFIHFLEYLINIIGGLETDEKIYIHCKGGHGRSGMLVACLLCILENITPEESIKKTTEYHRLRPSLKKKWLSYHCPNIKIQQDFIYEIFS